MNVVVVRPLNDDPAEPVIVGPFRSAATATTKATDIIRALARTDLDRRVDIAPLLSAATPTAQIVRAAA